MLHILYTYRHEMKLFWYSFLLRLSFKILFALGSTLQNWAPMMLWVSGCALIYSIHILCRAYLQCYNLLIYIFCFNVYLGWGSPKSKDDRDPLMKDNLIWKLDDLCWCSNLGKPRPSGSLRFDDAQILSKSQHAHSNYHLSTIITERRVIWGRVRGVVVGGCRSSVAEHWRRDPGFDSRWHHFSFFPFAVSKVFGQ